MAICKKAGFSLGTAVVLDTFITGGSVSLAGLGISGICQSLSDAGVNVFSGLCTHHLTKEKDGNSDQQLGSAFQQAVEQTLESVKNDFIKENNLDVPWLRAQLFKYGFDIPSFDDNYTLQNSLDRHFFQPLFRLLGDEEAIAEILTANQELGPTDFIKKLIEKEKIELPDFRKEHQEGLMKAIVDGFKARFKVHFIEKLLKDDRARKAYQVQLLQTSVTYLSKIDRKIDDLLDFAASHKIGLAEIDENINRKHVELINEFKKFRSDVLRQFSLSLIIHTEIRYAIKDQFRFDSLYTTFQGRTKELDQLSDFLYADSMFSFYAISGPGGAGKSRLANELCLNAHSGRWISGFCDQNKNRLFNWSAFRPTAQTLIVFDYIKGRKQEIADTLEILSYLAERKEFQYKVRVLLLERDFDEELRRIIFTSKTRTHYFTYSLNEEEKVLQLEEMDEDARWRIIEQVVRDLDDEDEINKILYKKSSILMELDKQDPEKRPLFTFFSAVALKEGANITGWNTNDNLKYHLERLENKVWSQVDIWNDGRLRMPLRHLIWLAAICEYLTFEDLEKIKELAIFEDLAKHWSNELFWKQLVSLFKMENIEALEDDFPGLKPDLLAEFYISNHLTTLLTDKSLFKFRSDLITLYNIAWNIKSANVWWMSWLTISNFLGEASSGLAHYIEWLSSSQDIENQYGGMLFFNLALLYNNMNQPEEAEQYYLKAIEKGEVVALFNLAALYNSLNRLEEAEQYYLKAIERGYVDALNNLAVLYNSLNRLEEAEQYYLKAIEKGYVDAFNNLAFLYNSLNRPDEAEQYYLKAIDKGNADALFNLAVLYNSLNRPDEAEQHYLKAIENGNVDSLNNLAVFYESLNRLEEAEQHYLKAIDKGNVSALFNLALLYNNLNRLEEAEQYYLKTIEKGNVDALNNLAFLYKNLNRPDEAEQHYLKAIHKGNVSALNNLALLHYKLNRSEEAEGFFLKAIQKGHVDALNNLAVFYESLNRQEEAEEYYFKATEKGHVDALNNLAVLYESLSRLEEAEQYYLKATEKGHVGALNNLALLYKNHNRLEEAEQYYLKAIEKGNADALFNLAVLYKNLNRLEEAELHYLKAIDKGNVFALNNLAVFYESLNRQEEAEEYYLKAIKKGYIDALHSLAALYKNLNRQEEAEQYYLKAIENGNVDSLNDLAVLYYNLNRLEEAEQYCLIAIENGNVDALNNLAVLYYKLNRLEEAEQYCLKAIENGNVDALNNLAVLYKNLNRLEEAEQCYLKAIENGNVNALKYLAIFYWEKNQKKDPASDLIELYIKNTRGQFIEDHLIHLLISAWTKKKDFQEHRLSVLNKFVGDHSQLIPQYLMILYHDTSSFLINEFEEGSLSDHLKNNHYLEYLVTLYFSRPDDPKLMSIPLDIKPQYDELVAEITEKRKFYNGPSRYP